MKIEGGKSENGYGYWLWLGRLRITTRNQWCATWPKSWVSYDENCNRVPTFILWPLGGLEYWWDKRTDEDGQCDECKELWTNDRYC